MAPAIATHCGSSCLGLVLLGVSVPIMAPCPRARALRLRSQLSHGIAGMWDLALLPVQPGSHRFRDWRAPHPTCSGCILPSPCLSPCHAFAEFQRQRVANPHLLLSGLGTVLPPCQLPRTRPGHLPTPTQPSGDLGTAASQGEGWVSLPGIPELPLLQAVLSGGLEHQS